jgi:hypothetical protein
MMRTFALSMLICGSLSLLSVSAVAQSYSPREGQSHPDFTLPNILDGEPVSLSQFRGKKVLLINFASW